MTLKRDGATFKDGDHITVEYEDQEYGDIIILTNCKLIHRKDAYGSPIKKWYILSNNRILDGDRPREELNEYKYSWSLGSDGFCSSSIRRIKHSNPQKNGK